jgi:hypothetical protein
MLPAPASSGKTGASVAKAASGIVIVAVAQQGLHMVPKGNDAP